MKAALIAFILIVLTGPAFAQLAGTDAAPDGSCVGTPAGAARVTADADGNRADTLLICNGTVWKPQSVRVSYDEMSCTGAKEGTIRFISATDAYEFCNGSAWTPFEQATPDGHGYLVQTATLWNGNLGGLSGADAKCLTELQTTYDWQGKGNAGTLTSARVKAFLCDATTCNNLEPDTVYLTAKANDTATGGTGFRTDANGNGPSNAAWWDEDTFSATPEVWTNRGVGAAELWPATPHGINHCTNWTSSAGGVSGRIGNAGNNNANRWSSNIANCNTTKFLYCFVNPAGAPICTPSSWCAEAWKARTADANSWEGVTYGNGLFVAVAGNGTSRVTTSPDGMTWTARTAAEANSWQSVTYGNGVFVAVASGGTSRVMTSPDGVTWTARTAAAANQWTDVTYGNGLFVAVSNSGTNQVMTSPDGVTWTARTAPGSSSWRSVTYGNSLFVAVGEGGTNHVMTSPNGVTWTARTAAEANQWWGVTYGNGLYVAVANNGTNQVMTSPDGVTWTARTEAQANLWNGVTYGDGLFVAVANGGTNRVMTSPDGVTWTARTAAEANSWEAITYGDGLFVAVASVGTNRVMTSPCACP